MADNIGAGLIYRSVSSPDTILLVSRLVRSDSKIFLFLQNF